MYPFMDAGALLTPLNWLVFQSCEPQKFTWLPFLCSAGVRRGAVPRRRRPRTRLPPKAGAAVVSVAEALAGR